MGQLCCNGDIDDCEKLHNMNIKGMDCLIQSIVGAYQSEGILGATSTPSESNWGDAYQHAGNAMTIINFNATFIYSFK